MRSAAEIEKKYANIKLSDLMARSDKTYRKYKEATSTTKTTEQPAQLKTDGGLLYPKLPTTPSGKTYTQTTPNKSYTTHNAGTVNPSISVNNQDGKTYTQMLAESKAKRNILESGAGYVPETSVQDAKNLIYGAPIRGGTVNPTISAAEFYSMYDMITPQEAGTYKHYKTLGDEKKASEYLKAITPDINRRSAEKRMADTRRLAEDSTIGGLYARYMASLSSPLGAAYSLVQSARGEAIDPNSPFFMAEHTKQGQEEAFIGDSTGFAKLAKQAGLAAFDWGTQIATLGALGFGGEAMNIGNSALYGASAYAGNTKDATERGATPTEAAGYGVIGAAAEVVTERLGFERLFKLGGMANKGVARRSGGFDPGAIRQVLKGLLPNMASEGLEEGATEAVNLISDALIMGDRSQMAEIYNTAKAQGMSEGQAAKEAILAGVKQIGTAASVGAISGGMIAGGVAGGSRLAGRNILPENNDLPDLALPGEAEAQQAALKAKAPTMESSEDTAENVVKSHENVVKSHENTIKSHENVTKAPENVANENVARRRRPEEELRPWSGSSDLGVFKKADSSDYAGKYFYEAGQRLIREEEAKRGNVDFIPGVQTYYEAGLAGILEKNIKQTAYTAITDRELLTRAYLAGSADRKADVEARLKGESKLKGEAGVVLATEAATEAQKAFAKLVADTSGAEVMLVDRIGSVEEGYKNGYYKDGRIVVALNADSFTGTLWHESIHYIKEAAPEAYEFLQQTVFQMAAEREDISVDEYMNRYREEYEEVYKDITAVDVIEEMTADAFMAITKDEKGMEDMIQRLSNENPTMLEKLKEFLEKLIESLQALIKDQRFNSFSEDIAADVKQAEALRDMLANGLRYAGEQRIARRRRPEEELRPWSDSSDPGQTRTGEMESGADMESHTEKEAKYSLIGKTKDGVEVYETSEEIKKLSWAERKKQFLRLMDEEYLGRTAKFKNGNKVYYAKFESADLQKNIYGDQKSDAKGKDAKINVGAEGNVFELVENAKYNGRKVEMLGKKNKAHRNVQSWDYFAKTVQVDGIVFDILINVRKKIGSEYVYSIQMNENKNKSAEPPIEPAYNRKSEMATRQNRVHSADKNNIPQQKAEVNYKNITNSDIEDAKFSIKQQEYEELLEENEHLKAANEALRQQFEITKGAVFDEATAKKAVRQWLKKHKSVYNADGFTEKYLALCEVAAKAKNDTEYNQVMTALQMLAEEALQESGEIDTTLRDENKELIKKIRMTTIKVNEKTKAELEYYGGYNQFRKANFGRIRLSSENGVTPDTFFQELEEEYPQFFSTEGVATQGDMLLEIVRVLDSLKPVIHNPYGYDLSGYALDAAYELFDMFQEVQLQKPTFADRYEAKLEKVREKYKRELELMREGEKEKYEQWKEFYKKRMKENYSEWKEGYRERTKDWNEWYKERYREWKKDWKNKQRDREEWQRRRNSIEKNARALLKWIETPTDNQHIPKHMLAGVQELLSRIHTTDKDITLRQHDLGKAVRNIAEMRKRGLYIELDPAIEEYIEAFGQEFGRGVSLEEMGKDKTKNINHIRSLDNMIKSLKKTITDANKTISAERSKRISEIGDEFIANAKKKRSTKEAGMMRTLGDIFDIELLDEERFFQRIGGEIYTTLYRGGLRKGLDKKIELIRKGQDFLKETATEKELKEWSNAKAQTFSFGEGENKEEIEMTIPQIMSLYCLMKRKAAVRHIIGETKEIGKKQIPIYGGGFRTAGTKKGKRSRNITPTKQQIETITKTLTARQKKVAESIQRYFSTEAAAWGNGASMLLFGYEKFTDSNYFPIVTDKDFTNRLVTKEENISPTVKSMGMTKRINQYANNPIIVEDIFDVYAKHIDQMANYAAFAPIESDMNKLMNYKQKGENGEPLQTVRSEMSRTMGKKADAHISALMNRIVTAANLSDDIGAGRKMVSNMKVASVGANLRVVIQQPTAYVRAAALIDPQYLLAGMAAGKADYEKIYQYAPIAWWKEQGFYEMDTGRSMKEILVSQGFFRKWKERSMFLAGAADKLTWGRIWKACEIETKVKHPELKEEVYYKKVGERFSQIIDETQVVDSVLHRTQIMRRKGLYTQMATSFMSEPLKTYNMFVGAFNRMLTEKTAESKKAFLRSFTVLVMNGIAVSAAAGLIDMFRDDDDEKSLLEKWLGAVRGDYSEAENGLDYVKAALQSNLADNLNPMNMIPLMRDMMSLIQGYDVSRSDFLWAADIAKVGKQWLKVMQGERQYTTQAMILNSAACISKATGLPINSIKRDLGAIKNSIYQYACGAEKQYENKAATYYIGGEKNAGMYAKKILEARMSGNTALATRIFNDMVKHGIDNESINTKITNQEKKKMEREMPTLIRAAEAFHKGDAGGYADAVEELLKKGYREKPVKSKINSVYDELYDKKEKVFEEITEEYWKEGIATDEKAGDAEYTMLFNAWMNGDNKDFEEMWGMLEASGAEEKDIKNSIKRRLKNEYHRAKDAKDYSRMEKAEQGYLAQGGKKEKLLEKPK